MRMATQALALAAVWAMIVVGTDPPAVAEVKPARRVVATYFHRTVRCPTCQKVGAALEAVMKTRFGPERSAGRLQWRMMDFQDPRNASFAVSFRLTGPALIIMDVEGNRILGWKPAPRVWSLVGDEAAFTRYVEAEVRSVLAVQAVAAR